VGDLTLAADASWSWNYVPLDGPDDSQVVRVDAGDDTGGIGSGTFELNVINASPQIAAITGPVAPVQVNAAIDITAIFTDPGILDTHTASIAWGDGSVCNTDVGPDCSVDQGIGIQGSVAGSHAYAEAGIYSVQLAAADDDGGVGTAILEFLVAYDPGSGFVTGGGWIDSPEGAYVPDPSLTGKAHFGFVSKYKTGARTPTGQTEFQFRAGDLDFHSDSYEWLVVAGVKAMYKGVGTVNGEGEYRFILSAIDADLKATDTFSVDRFRIRIWTEGEAGEEHVMYDNALGDDSDDAMTEIGGGSIVIHRG